MITKAKNIILNNIVYRKISRIPSIRRWLNASMLNPHSYLKQKVVKKYAKRFSMDYLIETGTCGGDMLYATRKTFKKLYSIELAEIFYKLAKKRLSKYKHISLYHGDSVEVLPKILENIKKPCLFWLDAHYSGGYSAKGNLDTPIMQELRIIFDKSKFNHVFLIDDAKLFLGKNDYPTLKELKDFIISVRSDFTLMVKYDIIRIHKK